MRRLCTTALWGIPTVQLGWAAMEGPPKSYEAPSPSGEYVFVMLAPELRGWDAEGEAIRERYPASGMYRADDPSEPLWTVDWHSTLVGVLDDGVHVVRLGSKPTKGRLAVAFYEGGEEICSYDVGDLVDFPWLIPQRDLSLWWCGKTELDHETGRLRIVTLTFERLDFDVTTGEIVSSFRPLRLILLLAAVIIGVRIGLRFLRSRRPPKTSAVT